MSFLILSDIPSINILHSEQEKIHLRRLFKTRIKLGGIKIILNL